MYCPSDFKSTGSHRFYVVSHADNSLIPPKKCAIRSGYDNSYLEVDYDHKEIRSRKIDGNSALEGNENYFVANDVGDGKVTIFNFLDERYVAKDGRHLVAKEIKDCGNHCHFILEDLRSISPTTAAPTTTATTTAAAYAPTGLLIKKSIVNPSYIKQT